MSARVHGATRKDVMPLRQTVRPIVALSLLLLTGCAAAPHAARRLPTVRAVPTPKLVETGRVPDYVQANRPGPPVSDLPGRLCLKALKKAGVNTAQVSAMSGGYPEQPIKLARSLVSGPVPQGQGFASGVETATWNLLSRASGLPLTPYRGQTLLEVPLNAYGSTRVGGYTCFEKDHKVVGMIAEQPNYSFQPMFDVSLRGRTVHDLTGLYYLQWLESVGAYVPHPTANRPGMSAEAVLLDYLDVLNADLPAAERRRLEATLVAAGPGSAPLASQAEVLQALVPITFQQWQAPPASPGMDPRLLQIWNVALWPHFRHFTAQDLAGNGWLSSAYTVARKSPGSPWLVVSSGTGP